MGAVRGYARVSTSRQADHGISLEAQRTALLEAGAGEVYADTASGTTTSRPELDQLLRASMPGDTVLIYELSRLGRDSLHIQQTVKELGERGVALRSLTEPIFDGSPHTTQLLVAIMSTLNQIERERISARTKASLQAKKARGERLGRAPLAEDPAKQAQISKARKLRDRGNSYGDIAAALGISRATAHRWLALNN